MPKITGKITDTEGNPIYQVAEISEIPLPLPGNVLPATGANVWSDENTGEFTFIALYPTSVIKVASNGYKVRTFQANAVPAVITWEPAIKIEGKTTKKPDNTLLILGGVLLALGVAAYAFNGKPEPAAKQPAKRKATPGLARLAKPKTVHVKL